MIMNPERGLPKYWKSGRPKRMLLRQQKSPIWIHTINAFVLQFTSDSFVIMIKWIISKILIQNAFTLLKFHTILVNAALPVTVRKRFYNQNSNYSQAKWYTFDEFFQIVPPVWICSGNADVNRSGSISSASVPPVPKQTPTNYYVFRNKDAMYFPLIHT